VVGSYSLLPTIGLAQNRATHATLSGWERQIWNFMLDRTHDFGGTNYNRGLFREHINYMSPEHEIDLMTYGYTLIDDYEWEKSSHAYRVSMGSLNALNFAIENSIKDKFVLNKKNSFSVEGYQESVGLRKFKRKFVSLRQILRSFEANSGAI